MSERCEQLLAVVRKNAREEIRVTRGEYKGCGIIGVRVWFLHCRTGEMRPSNDGVDFRAALLDDVIGALQAAKAEGGR
jgi:hypothetical protein